MKESFKDKNTWFNFAVLLMFTVIIIPFEILCLNGLSDGVLYKFKEYLKPICILLSLIMLAVSFFFYLKKLDGAYKLCISLYVLLVFALVVIFIMQKSGFFKMIKTPETFAEYLEKSGQWMAIAYILLQFLQVIILPIPSFVSTVAGVALFGALPTLFYSYCAIVPASIIAFFLGRKLGRKAVVWMIGESTLVKWQTKLKGKDNLILTSMFLLPLFPDDILCFVAGLSSMSNKYFIIMILICRLVNLTGTTFSIDFIPFTTWWGIALWIILGIVFSLVFLYIYKNTDKFESFFKKNFFKKTDSDDDTVKGNE